MWMMNCCSDGVSNSSFWIKYLSIVPNVGSPLTFWKNDELLMEDEDGFVFYNRHSKKLRKLINHVVDHTFYGSYVKSLIYVNR